MYDASIQVAPPTSTSGAACGCESVCESFKLCEPHLQMYLRSYSFVCYVWYLDNCFSMCMYVLYLDILICKNSQRLVGMKGFVSIRRSRYVRMNTI